MSIRSQLESCACDCRVGAGREEEVDGEDEDPAVETMARNS